MNIAIQDVPVDEINDAELFGWVQERLYISGKTRIHGNAVDLYCGILRVFDEVGPTMTVRQIFYALTVRKLIPKTEAGYRQAAYYVLNARRAGISTK